jgi:hypothetical protein
MPIHMSGTCRDRVHIKIRLNEPVGTVYMKKYTYLPVDAYTLHAIAVILRYALSVSHTTAISC